MQVPTISTLGLLLFMLISQSMLAQQDEPAVDIRPNLDPQVLWWENYYQNLLSERDAGKEELGEGTGYLPYLRARKFYEDRMDANGKIAPFARWEAFKASKEYVLSRDGVSQVADWQNLGPNTMETYGGRMISHAFDPVDPEIVWAGSASGGLWKTEDGGENWVPKTNQLPSTGVGAVAVNPQNSQAILIGTGEGYNINFSIKPGIGVFKSTDNGSTWQETNLQYAPTQGVSSFKFAWDPVDTNRVYMAATNGVWTSDDAGMTWAVVLPNSSANDIILHPTDRNILFAGVEGVGIYKSSDAGENWQLLGGGLPAAGTIDFIRIAMCTAQPDVLYASITDNTSFGLQGLYRTDDGGTNWRRIAQAPNAFCTPPNLGLVACQGWYDNAVGVSPFNPDRVLFGGITLWLSDSGGTFWSQKDRYTCLSCITPPPGKVWVDQHDIGFSPHDPDVVYVFNDGGVGKSTDGGRFFELKNRGLETAQFYKIASAMTDTNVIIGGMQDHGLQGTDLSDYPNREWRVWGFLDGTEVAVDHTDASTFYGVWADGQYLRTRTGVDNYDTQMINTGIDLTENSFFYFNPFRMDHQDPQVLYTATTQRLYKTSNGGNQWQAVGNIANCKAIEVDRQNPNYVYAATYSNAGTWNFYRSSDAGENWQTTANRPGWRVTDIEADPLEEGVLYVTRNSAFANMPHIYRSRDYGDTWEPLQGNLPDIPVSAVAVNAFDNNCIYLATDLGVYISVDGGQEWVEYNYNIPVTFVNDIHYHPADSTVRIGTYGRGAWKTKSFLTSTTVDTGEELEGAHFIVGQPFPSPATEAVSVTAHLPTKQQLTVKIFNLLGQEVHSLVEEESVEGEHTFKWSLQDKTGRRVQAGIYFYWIKVADQAITRKVIVQ